MMFAKWKGYLSSSIELQPIELPGRGKRYHDPFKDNLFDLVDDIYLCIKDYIDKYPYAFFGHSMGSWIIYELCHKIQMLNHKSPIHIFFSAQRAPHIKREEKMLHTLPEEEFKKEIYDLGGTPKELLENKELLEYFLPILRADYKVVETYSYLKKDRKLSSAFTILNGKEDNLTSDEIMEWCEHTNNECTIYNFQGGHFFINDKMQNVIEIINNTLKNFKGEEINVQMEKLN